MRSAPRSLALALFAVAALCAAGCGSNNKDVIVGKWKVVGTTDRPMFLTSESDQVFEFGADGQFRIYTGSGTQGADVLRGRYTLDKADWVVLSDLSKPIDGRNVSRESITIDGDNMIINGNDGKKMKLTRVK